MAQSTISTSSPALEVAVFFLSFRSKIARRSLSNLSEVTTTLLGWTPIGVVAPFDLSLWTRSTWITHFLRYTCVTFPSRPLYLPRTILTSSSLRIGIDRVLYFPRSSLDREDDMIFLRTDEGAEKWALRDLRRDEEVSALNFILSDVLRSSMKILMIVRVTCHVVSQP